MLEDVLARSVLLGALAYLVVVSPIGHRRHYAAHAHPNERLYVHQAALGDPSPKIRLILDPWAEQHRQFSNIDTDEQQNGGLMMSASEEQPAFGTRIRRPTPGGAGVSSASVGASLFRPAAPPASSSSSSSSSPRSARLLSNSRSANANSLKPSPPSSSNSLTSERVKIERLNEEKVPTSGADGAAIPTEQPSRSSSAVSSTTQAPTTFSTTESSPTTGTVAVDQCAPLPQIQCNPRDRYRTHDGSCNNLAHPRWGKAYECFERVLEPHYGDSLSSPRVALSGGDLPPARILSNLLHGQRLTPANQTHMIMQFGQFMTHDILFTPLADNLVSQSKVSCCPTMGHPECYPIRIPRDDPWYSQFPNKTCNTFLRSEVCHRCGERRREQITQMSAYLDASNLYAARLNDSFLYRGPRGTLDVSYDRNSNAILPRARAAGIDQCSEQQPAAQCFQAGDARVNQHPGLTSMNIIFTRQHNRLANRLADLNPHWDDETVYQETRRIIGAQMQMITYNEYLPAILGPELMNMFGLTLLQTGYTAYEPDLNPSMVNEFATGAFRFGHSMISGAFQKLASNGAVSKLDLRHNFFHPHELLDGHLDAILRGLIAQPAEEFDSHLGDDVRNHLFRPPHRQFGADLASQNIQRGRDHALPGYVYHLNYCFNITVTQFEELDAFLPRETREWLQVVYENVQDVDLFTAGTSEFPLKNAVVGPTFACYIGMQFEKIKYGDRFWFEHGGEAGSFTPAQLRSLRQTTLAKVLCANADNIKFVQQWVMHFPSNRNGALHCDSLADLDISAWKDTKRG